MKLALKVFAIASIIFVSSCKKEDNLRREKMTLLTAASWKTTKVEYQAENGNWIDVTATVDATSSDHILTYYINGEYILDEGKIKAPGNPQIIAYGNWTFKDNGTKIQIIDGNLMDILEITETKLYVHVTSAKQRYTFEHPQN